MALKSVLEFFLSEGLAGEKLICCGDSKLVVNQMSGRWRAKEGLYLKYYHETKSLVQQFADITFEWIPREQNGIADELSKQSMIENNCEFKIQPLNNG